MVNYIRKDSLLQRKVSIYWVIIFAIIPTIGLIYFATLKTQVVASEPAPCDVYSSVTNTRIQSYEFTRPLLFYDVIEEDNRLADVKAKIQAFIEQKKSENVINTASVYLRKSGGWVAINQNELYTPASLTKVPIMITYLKDVEKNPSLMDRKFYFDHHFGDLPKQNIKVFAMEEKKYYTVRDLLHYMIAFSDNDALNVLYQNMNNATFRQLFSDLKMEAPNLEKDNFRINVSNYAKFLRILMNATYLSDELSNRIRVCKVQLFSIGRDDLAHYT